MAPMDHGFPDLGDTDISFFYPNTNFQVIKISSIEFKSSMRSIPGFSLGLWALICGCSWRKLTAIRMRLYELISPVKTHSGPSEAGTVSILKPIKAALNITPCSPWWPVLPICLKAAIHLNFSHMNCKFNYQYCGFAKDLDGTCLHHVVLLQMTAPTAANEDTPAFQTQSGLCCWMEVKYLC